MRTLLLLLAAVVIASAKLNKATLLCTFCESFISGIETGLLNEEPDIVSYANKLCDNLTHNNQFLDPICKGLLDQELDSIIQWLNNDEKPHEICIKIHLC